MSTHLSDPQLDSKAEIEHIDDVAHKLKSAPDDIAYVPDTEAERRLVRKIDVRMLPILWIMYMFNYVDRTNIGNAKSGGMEKDLHLTSSDYSLILSIFFVGYLLNEIPCNMILSRTRPSLFLPSIMLCWGGMSIGVKGVTSLGGMVAFRMVLGLVEAGYFPGVMLLLSCWYKPAELSKRVALFYTASLVSGAFGGLLAGGIITGLEGVDGIRGWKWLFIIEGLITISISIVGYFLLPDYPSTTKWLSDDEKRLASIRLTRGEQAHDSGEPMSHKQAFLAAVKDPRTWVFLVTYNMLNSVGTISYFFPTLMGSLGYKGRRVQFMTVPIYIVALVIALSVGYNADRTKQKALHAVGACTLGVVSFIVCAVVKNDAVRYAFICFGGAGIWTAVPLLLSWLITMFDGREKRAISIALINGFGNLSSVYGSFFWPESDAPLYHKGFAITTALLAAAGTAMFLIRLKFGDKGYVH